MFVSRFDALLVLLLDLVLVVLRYRLLRTTFAVSVTTVCLSVLL